MIRQNQKILNTTLILLDALIFLFSMITAYFLRFSDLIPLSLFRHTAQHIPLDFYFKLTIIALPTYLFIYNYNRLYESYRSSRLITETGRVIRSNFAGILFVFLLSFLLKEVDVSRLVLLLFGAFNTTLMLASRVALRLLLRTMRRKGYNLKRLLIIGNNELAQEFAQKIHSNPNLGFQITGYHLFPYNAEHLEKILRADAIDEVIIALDYADYHLLPQLIDACDTHGAKVRILPFYTRYLPAKPYFDDIDGLSVINIRRIPLDNLLNKWSKRLFDFAASLLLVILLSPLLLATAIGVKLSSLGPVLYKQERVGLNKKTFTMYKFRSMKIDQGGQDKTAWSTKNDPRKTPFGTWIRKYSIDELPQLFNVLLGNMSLVGPRPEIPHHVDHFRDEIPLYMVKHHAPPGITGWAQVNGFRGDTSIKGRIECDIYYIENWTFLLDLKILIMTLFKGVVNHSE